MQERDGFETITRKMGKQSVFVSQSYTHGKNCFAVKFTPTTVSCASDTIAAAVAASAVRRVGGYGVTLAL